MSTNIIKILPTVQRASTNNFTDDQKKAYDELINFINSPFNRNDCKRALIGAAGTGKTYLVKALLMNSNLSYSIIGLSAPTHKACRVLGGSINLKGININTLQSDLGFKLNFDLEKFDPEHPPFDKKGRIKIGEYKLYIVDEASMINRGLASFLEKTCADRECKLIYIGDDSQLAPVGEKYSSAFKGVKSCILKEIVRQGDDNPITYLLELLRYDIAHKSYNFLRYIQQNPMKFNADYTKGYQVCNADKFREIVYTNFSDEQLTQNVDFAKIIAYTNANVSAWNKFVRNSIIEDSDKSIITKNDLFISYNTILNKFNSAIIQNSEEYIINSIVNYVHPTYGLKGFMVRFTAIHGGNTTEPLFILDHTDQFSLNQYVNISDSMIESATNARVGIKAQKWRDYYAFREGCLLLTNILSPDGTKIKYSRDIDYGFALTAHKSQGSTFDTSLVDVDNIVYNRLGQPYTDAEEVNRRLYVATSRCKNKLYLKFGK